MRIYPLSPLKFILILLIIALVVTFGAKNMTPVELKYYFGLDSQGIPLFFLLIAAVAFGAFVVWLYFAIYQIKVRGIVKKQARRIRELEKELGEISATYGASETVSSRSESPAPIPPRRETPK